MKLFIKLSLILIAFLSNSISETEAIKCYKCGASSGSANDCHYPNLVPEECDGQYKGFKVDACEQIINDKGDEKRSCIASRAAAATITVDGRPLETGKCYMDVRVGSKGFSIENKSKKYCTCFENGCNSVSKEVSYTWLVITMSIVPLLIRSW